MSSARQYPPPFPCPVLSAILHPPLTRTLCNLAVQVGLLGGASGARHAALGVDDDVLRSDEASLEQRVQRQLGARRVAARVGQQAGALDLLAPKLRDAVHRLLLQLHRRMLMPVPVRGACERDNACTRALGLTDCVPSH
eukprot:185469-Chlamydomonas_euryale.AAC.3